MALVFKTPSFPVRQHCIVGAAMASIFRRGTHNWWDPNPWLGGYIDNPISLQFFVDCHLGDVFAEVAPCACHF